MTDNFNGDSDYTPFLNKALHHRQTSVLATSSFPPRLCHRRLRSGARLEISELFVQPERFSPVALDLVEQLLLGLLERGLQLY